MRCVIASVRSPFQLKFFARFAAPLRAQGMRLHLLTNRLALYRRCIALGLEASLIRGGRGDEDIVPERYLEYRSGVLSAGAARKAKSAVRRTLASLCDRNEVGPVLVWNGSGVIEGSLGEVACELDLEVVFLDLGNFPGKLFVDPCGITARSWIAAHWRDVEIPLPTVERYRLWREGYLKSKEQQHAVPQARNARYFNWNYPLDLFGFYALGAPAEQSPQVLRRTLKYFYSAAVTFSYDAVDLQTTDYVFFPMQVSSDSQLAFNSEVGNLEAIRLASEIAAQEGAQLLVKPHPAEPDQALVKKVEQLKADLGFFLVNDNTFDLIRYSRQVITINSTVGLEAMIAGRPVRVLGRALYEGFGEEQIAYYLMDYLVDIDFFSDQPISVGAASRVLERAGTGKCLSLVEALKGNVEQ